MSQLCGVSCEACAVPVFSLSLASALLNAILAALVDASSVCGVVLVCSGCGDCVGVCCSCREAVRSRVIGVVWFVVGLDCGVSGGGCAVSVCGWSMSVVVICEV